MVAGQGRVAFVKFEMTAAIIVERKLSTDVCVDRKAFMASVEGCSLALSSMEGSRSEVDLAALVETYSSLLFRVAHSVLRSRSEAEDVVQDVFVRVLEHRGSLPVIRDMRVWLVRIAWNLAIDRRRRIRPEQFDEGFAESLVARESSGG